MRFSPSILSMVTLTLQKSEGFRFGVFKGEAVVYYCDPLETPNLEFSGFPEG